MASFDDETLAKLEKKLIAAGYTDGEWRSIMYRYYGEDYEGMAERAKLRAEERERRKLAMDITGEISQMGAFGASKMDRAAVGGTQTLLERNLNEYFPGPPVKKEDRKLKFGLAPPTQAIAQTVGTFAPGREGITSQGPLTLATPKKEEPAEGEEGGEGEEEQADAGEGGEDKEEGDADGEGGGGGGGGGNEEEEIDEDELMFIWNKREAPQYRRQKVDDKLQAHLKEADEIEDKMAAKFAEAEEKDKAFWETVGVSAEHPFGTLDGGQFSHFLSKLEQKPTTTVWDGQHQTARWALETADEDRQPEDRSALLPRVDGEVEGLDGLYAQHSLIQTQQFMSDAEQRMLRDSLGPSSLEMPPDVDPHYMQTTLSTAAHAMNVTTAAPRPTEQFMTTQGGETKAALEGLKTEREERLQKQQEKLKKVVLKEPGENIDIPAVLLRKFTYLKNPRYKDPKVDFRSLLDTVAEQKAEAEAELPLGGKVERATDTTYVGPVVFKSIPSVVHFSEYEVGKVYEMPLRLQNASSILRRVKVLPPASKHFSVSLVKYLGEDGLVAPGLYCMCHIRFLPDTLADYEDVLHVVTEQGLLSVPLLARRLPPSLTIPETIDVGNCYQNDRKSLTLACKNQGGRGRFLLIPDTEWPEPPEDVHERASVVLAPFRVTPASWELNMGESIDLHIDFCPSAAEECKVGFRLVCDNCSVQSYSLLGTGLTPSVQLIELDTEQVGPPLSDQYYPKLALCFPSLAPGAEEAKQVVIANRSPLPLAYHWVVEHEDTPHTLMQSYLEKWGAVGEKHAVFSVQPSHGTLPPSGTIAYSLTFAPIDSAAYKAVARLMMHNIPSAERADGDDGSNGLGAGGAHYEEVEMTTVELTGSGGACEVVLEPAVLVVSQLLSVGKTYVRHVKVRNESDAATELEWERYPDLLYQAVKVVPDRVKLKPREERALKVEITPKVVAPLEVRLSCLVTHGAPLSISVFAKVMGPVMRVENANIDFGLLRVGSKAARPLTVANKCDVTARWSVRLKDAKTGQPWDHTIKVSPAKGILEAGHSVQLQVALRPEAPQRTRVTLEVQVEGGRSQFVAVHAEVVYAAVCLSESKVDLGTIFLAVPVTRTITLRNLTLLPGTSFSWDTTSALSLRPPGSAQFKLDFRVPSGSLGPDEATQVQMTLEALSLGEDQEDLNKERESADFEQPEPGEIERGERGERAQLGSASNPGVLQALIPLDVEGMPLPSGFEVVAKVMGLAVTYHVGRREELPQVPEHIKGTPAALQVGVGRKWPADLLGPDVDAPIVLDFGEKPAMQKHFKSFVIRNHTGIESAFSLHLEEYGVPAHELLLLTEQPPPHTAPPITMGGGGFGGGGNALTGGGRTSALTPTKPRSPSQQSASGSPRSRASPRLAGASRAGGSKGGLTAHFTTQSGFTVGSVRPRPSTKLTRQTGTIASVRMGANLERSVATGAAARGVSGAEAELRKQRARAPYVKDGARMLRTAVRKGHAEAQLRDFAKVHEENAQLSRTSLWSLPGDHTGIASRGKSQDGLRPGRIILGDEHEETARFRSLHGQRLLNHRNASQEAQQMLENGKGVGITCSAYTGAVPAWGEVEVRVDLFSDMCGVFRDRLVVDIMGLPPVHIPVVAKLTGSPVQIEGATLGLNLLGETPSLDFGDVLVNGLSQSRSLRVSNSSPWPVAVDWKVLEAAPAGSGNLVSLASRVTPDGKVLFDLAAIEPPEATSTPFALDPKQLLVPAHSTRPVTLTCQWHKPQHHEVFLMGDVAFLPKDTPMPGQESVTDKDRVVEPLPLVDRESADPGILSEESSGARLMTVEPLVVGLKCEVQGARLETDCQKHLKWVCSSSHDSKTHPSYVKEVCLSNRSRSNMTFALKLAPPFSIESTICTAPVHPMAKASDVAMTAMAAVSSPGTGNHSHAAQAPRLFTLPPNDSVLAKIRFTPPAKHRTGRTVDDALLFGDLVMLYSNEETQKLPLEAHIYHPQLNILPETLDFSTLHVESTATLTVALTNPTYADATWSIAHQPKLNPLSSTQLRSGAPKVDTPQPGGATQSIPLGMTTTGGAGVDDPEVWTFEPSSGVIKGNRDRPTIASTQIVTVRFHPKKNVKYSTKFKVDIECGRGGSIVLEGTGSYDENMEPGGSSGIIRDHPGYHPLLTGVRAPVVPNEHTHTAVDGGAVPPPTALPGWYDMDSAMTAMHHTKYTRPGLGFTGVDFNEND